MVWLLITGLVCYALGFCGGIFTTLYLLRLIPDFEIDEKDIP